jgi:hypothetical protein
MKFGLPADGTCGATKQVAETVPFRGKKRTSGANAPLQTEQLRRSFSCALKQNKRFQHALSKERTFRKRDFLRSL